jgi:hypothetical protein
LPRRCLLSYSLSFEVFAAAGGGTAGSVTYRYPPLIAGTNTISIPSASGASNPSSAI